MAEYAAGVVGGGAAGLSAALMLGRPDIEKALNGRHPASTSQLTDIPS